jgi:hypothetical protein
MSPLRYGSGAAANGTSSRSGTGRSRFRTARTSTGGNAPWERSAAPSPAASPCCRSCGPVRRWEAGWTVLAKAVDAGVPDIAARAAADLAVLRDTDWPVPSGIDAFIDLLQLSGVLPGGA